MLKKSFKNISVEKNGKPSVSYPFSYCLQKQIIIIWDFPYNVAYSCSATLLSPMSDIVSNLTLKVKVFNFNLLITPNLSPKNKDCNTVIVGYLKKESPVSVDKSGFAL